MNIPRLRFHTFDSEWVNNRLGDLIDIKGRIGYRGYTTNDIVNKGEGSISLSPSNIDSDGNLSYDNSTYITWEKYFESPEIIVEEGFTILVKTGSSFGKSGFIKDLPEKSTINPQLVVLKPTKINPFFLFTLTTLSSVQKQIKTMVVGGTIPTLSQENISNFKVNIPSLPEQQKIADFLTAVDKRIELLEKKKSLLETYKKGVMKKIFNQEIRFKDDNGNDFPDWEYKQISEVFQIMTSSSKSRYIDDSGVYFVMDMGGVDSNGKLTHHKKTSLDQDLIEPGLLVMPKDDIGGGNIIGKVGIIEKENTYVLGDHVYGLKTQTDEVVKFLYYSINSYEVNRSLRIKSTGTSQLGLNKKNVEKQIIPLPSKSEQKKISEFLTSIDIQIELLETQIDKSKTWKKGLLQKMFV